MLESKQQTLELIKKTKNILIIPSDPINGDNLGGSLALVSILQKMGKDARLVLSSKIPEKFNFLFATSQSDIAPGDTRQIGFTKTNSLSPDKLGEREFVLSISNIDEDLPEPRFGVRNEKLEIYLTSKKKIGENDVRLHPAPFFYEVIFTIGSQDLENLGQSFEANPELFFETPIVNIDNQPSNENFGEINLIDLTSSSATEIVMDLIKYLNQDLLDENIATTLLMGIISATNNFQSAKTCPKTFNNAAFLINKEANQQKIIRHLYKTKPLNFLKLWGAVLRKIRWDEKKKVISTTIEQADFKKTSASPDYFPQILEELKETFPQIKMLFVLWENPTSSDDYLETEQEIKEISGLIYSSVPDFLPGFVSKLETEETKLEITEKSHKNGNLIFKTKNISLKEAEEQILNLLDTVL